MRTTVITSASFKKAKDDKSSVWALSVCKSRDVCGLATWGVLLDKEMSEEDSYM